MPGDMEKRFAGELRVAGPRKLTGVAAPFNRAARIGGFTETIRPGAFAATLASGADVRALVDHVDTQLLGRTRSGTLRLWETRDGLAFDIDLPDTQLGRDVHTLAQRGDLSGMSFGFTVPTDGEAWPTRTTRELRAVDLAEISVLHKLPAYDQTVVAARARAMGRAEADLRLRRLVIETL